MEIWLGIGVLSWGVPCSGRDLALAPHWLWGQSFGVFKTLPSHASFIIIPFRYASSLVTSDLPTHWPLGEDVAGRKGFGQWTGCVNGPLVALRWLLSTQRGSILSGGLGPGGGAGRETNERRPTSELGGSEAGWAPQKWSWWLRAMTAGKWHSGQELDFGVTSVSCRWI